MYFALPLETHCAQSCGIMSALVYHSRRPCSSTCCCVCSYFTPCSTWLAVCVLVPSGKNWAESSFVMVLLYPFILYAFYIHVKVYFKLKNNKFKESIIYPCVKNRNIYNSPFFVAHISDWITLMDWFHLTLRLNLLTPTPNTWVSTLNTSNVTMWAFFTSCICYVCYVGPSQWTLCPWNSPTFAAAFCLPRWSRGGCGTMHSQSHLCMYWSPA